MSHRRRGLGSVRRLPSGSYQARIYVNGKRLAKTYPTRDMAKRWLETHRAAKATAEAGGQLSDPKASYAWLAPLLLEHYEAGTRRTYSRRTLESYRYELGALVEWWGDRPVHATRSSDIDEWVAAMRREGLSSSTIRHRLDRLSALHRFAVRAGHLNRLPCPVERPRLIQRSTVDVVTEDELAAILRRADVTLDPRPLVAVLLAADAGLRLSEIARLERRDCRGGVVHVAVRSEADRPKSGRARSVPMTQRLRASLDRLPDFGPTVLGVRSRHGVRDVIGKVMNPPRVHRLRHRFATRLAETGTPPDQVRVWLGHSTLHTTLRYFHTTPHGSVSALESTERGIDGAWGSARRQGHTGATDEPG